MTERDEDASPGKTDESTCSSVAMDFSKVQCPGLGTKVWGFVLTEVIHEMVLSDTISLVTEVGASSR
ncbi:hypothetical protein GCM10010448_32990 [Streptomyces glomeratus]|uniref:Uncharacterized protein n=1 Tax=Streptomyces glomeratus TaxID=284452 RepID=A0ABP6LNM2_9ACTN